MSWMTVSDIARRLKFASEESPLAVFRVKKSGRGYGGLYDAVFANTVAAQHRIETGIGLVGVFSSPSQFTEKLERSGSSDGR
ncbi:hypothetical protein [Microbulbifer sp. TYP-18]|uniref:hypothetical protein n=1 Tax=Microbulbifer sp. TYP-18 TaxID=3230024 RepID=UPI0034C698AF